MTTKVSMRPNNFDIVRLGLAVMVVFRHAHDLSQAPALLPVGYISSRLAVECFFVISGFLIFASYDRSKSLGEYYTNRAFRILPGYWLSTLFCLAIAATHFSFHVGKWLLANLTFMNFLQPDIAGVFEGNPTNHALNGALWTIKIEVMFYVAVPIIVWLCRRLHRDAVLVTLIVLSLGYYHYFRGHENLQLQLPGQLSFFLCGTLLYYHLALFKRRGWWLVVGAAALFALHAYTGWFALRPPAVAVLVLAACLLVPHVEGPARWGDFSYGTYILHYPIVQLVIEAGWYAAHPWLAFVATLVFAGLGAVLSWNFVEKRALAHVRSRKERRAALGAAANYPPAVP